MFTGTTVRSRSKKLVAKAEDFKTLLEWYFGGKFDENYLEQCDEDGEEPEPFSNWTEY